MKRVPILLCALLAIPRAGGAKPPVDRITLAAGFRVSAFASDVPGARSLALGRKKGAAFRDAGLPA